MKMRHLQLQALVALLLIGIAATSGLTRGARAVDQGTTELVSLTSDGTLGNNWSGKPAISGDGRYVAFVSLADNLVAGDTNGSDDVFVRDRQTGSTERVSLTSGGTQGYNHSMWPAISGDGRYVAFVSLADNLVAGDTNGDWDAFVRDRLTGTTERVSIAPVGTHHNVQSRPLAISGDGRFVAFWSSSDNLVAGDTNGSGDVFVHDRQTGSTERVSLTSDGTQGNNDSVSPAISGDGRYVAFVSLADNLVAGDTNGSGDVFVRDRQTGSTERVSLTSDGTQGNNHSTWPTISSDGRFVAFDSNATNLVAEDTNGDWDAFVRDRLTGTTERVSLASDGTQGSGSSGLPAISGDGRFVAFESYATNLVAGETNWYPDVFVRDGQTGTTERVSVASDGTQGNHQSDIPAISGNGRYVAFESYTSNLVEGDTNNVSDVFVRDRCPDGSCAGPTPTPPPTPSPSPTPITTSADRKVIILGGIDSEATCDNNFDGLDLVKIAIKQYVLDAQDQLAEPIFNASDFIEFNWRGGGRCPGDSTQVEYDKIDTCVGVEEGAKRLDALIRGLPRGTTVDLVGHSLGGIVAAYWAATKDTAFLQTRVHSVITMDSPLHGAPDVSGWFWENFLVDSVCPANSGSKRDIKVETGVIPALENLAATRRESFASVVCSPAGHVLSGSWKEIQRPVYDHSCAWHREDTKGFIALSLFETFVDDRVPQGKNLEPKTKYVSGWIEQFDDDAARQSLHLTRSTRRKIELKFTGGEIVMHYLGERVCIPGNPCTSDNAPLINAYVDLPLRLDRFKTDCLLLTRCRVRIASGLSAASHRLDIEVVRGTGDVYFRFDGLSVCPRTNGGAPLNLGGLPCGYTE